jgi:hypothetical protein
MGYEMTPNPRFPRVGAAVALAIIAVMLLFIFCGPGDAAEMTLIRTVPDGASLSYSVGDSVIQTMPLRAGTYQIIIKELPVFPARRHGPRVPLPRARPR